MQIQWRGRRDSSNAYALSLREPIQHNLKGHYNDLTLNFHRGRLKETDELCKCNIDYAESVMQTLWCEYDMGVLTVHFGSRDCLYRFVCAELSGWSSGGRKARRRNSSNTHARYLRSSAQFQVKADPVERKARQWNSFNANVRSLQEPGQHIFRGTL